MSPLAITGMRHAAFTARDGVVLGVADERAGARAAVHGERLHARGLGDARDAQRVAARRVRAGADLQRDRHVDRARPRRRGCAPPAPRCRSSAEPAATLQTFFAGQPMLMSMICAPRVDVVARGVRHQRRVGAGDLHRDRGGLARVVAAAPRLRACRAAAGSTPPSRTPRSPRRAAGTAAGTAGRSRPAIGATTRLFAQFVRSDAHEIGAGRSERLQRREADYTDSADVSESFRAASATPAINTDQRAASRIVRAAARPASRLSAGRTASRA